MIDLKITVNGIDYYLPYEILVPIDNKWYITYIYSFVDSKYHYQAQ